MFTIYTKHMRTILFLSLSRVSVVWSQSKPVEEKMMTSAIGWYVLHDLQHVYIQNVHRSKTNKAHREKQNKFHFMCKLKTPVFFSNTSVQIEYGIER